MKQGGAHPALKWHTHPNSPKGFDGFTIVETLIVLAVTGTLLISAIALINGKQRKTEFYTSINGLQQQLQQIINETASGYYPNAKQLSCTAAGSAQPTISGGVKNDQGTNGGCVFLGKVAQFGVPGTADNFLAYSIAGNQSATSLTTAKPIAIAQGTGSYSSVPDLYEGHIILGGLTVGAMYYNGAISQKTAGVGFLAGNEAGVYATDDPSGSGSFESGSQQLSLYAVRNTAINVTSGKTMVNSIDAANGANLLQVKSVTICMVGSVGQLGIITIGDSGSQTAVSLNIKQGAVCS